MRGGDLTDRQRAERRQQVHVDLGFAIGLDALRRMARSNPLDPRLGQRQAAGIAAGLGVNRRLAVRRPGVVTELDGLRWSEFRLFVSNGGDLQDVSEPE